MLPAIEQLAAGEFGGTTQEKQLVQLLARVVVAELQYRARQREAD